MNEARYRAAEKGWWAVWAASPTERWLELERPMARVRVLEIGEGPPLVFVHGGPGAASIFAPLASALLDFRCIVIDRPGCGLSPAWRLAGESLNDRLAALLRGCLDALGLDRARLVGSSFGSSCLLWLAQRHPDRVKRLAHLGCPALLSGSTLPFMVRLLAAPVVGYLAARLPANRTAVRSFLGSMGERPLVASGRMPEAFYDWWISLTQDTDTMPNEREMIRRALKWTGATDLKFSDASVQALEVPMYFYWGADEPFASVAFASNLVQGMRRATIDVVPGVGHLPWLGKRDDVADRVRSFMRG